MARMGALASDFRKGESAMNAPEIVAAAEWWATTISGRPKQDNGDAFQSALLTMVALERPRPTPDQLAKFKERLMALLSVHWDESKPYRCRFLSVDYWPDYILQEAAEAAGINCSFPVKTMMCISAGKVTVACGYGAPDKVIYPTCQAEVA